VWTDSDQESVRACHGRNSNASGADLVTGETDSTPCYWSNTPVSVELNTC